MSRKKLIWNVATAKTGNSARWDFLRFNKPLLKEAGFHAAPLLKMTYPDWQDSTQGPGLLKKILDETDETVLLIEYDIHPDLAMKSKKIRELREFLGNPEMTAILYLRRQDLFLESFYREIIRCEKGAMKPFSREALAEYYGADLLDYADMIEFLEKEFDHVVIRPFQKQTFVGGGLFQDYCDAAGIQWNDGFRIPQKKVNRAPDARLSEALIKCDEHLPKDAGQARRAKEILEELGRVYFAEAEDCFFEVDERKAFLEGFAEGNRWIAKRYGIGDELFLMDDLDSRRSPKKLTTHDALMLLLYVNQSWLNCQGAVPFPVYNYNKIKYLKKKMHTVSATRKIAISVQILLHQGFYLARKYLYPKKWSDAHADGVAMNYVMKNIQLFVDPAKDYLG